MQAKSYNPIVARNIPAEMAELARERGEGLTKQDLLDHGYTDEEITRHSHDASVLFARSTLRRVA
ncbi:hypothetical protein HGP14_02795 [Rhizobium sp. P32RR-XVIII]|uniref:hypothetical protein n=1 Tax=Rhizobium sp. P32RR-XVIII TaxID=2726738 RepID=UPI0014572153|nr:hypothetical protein [Rhizobium sp. P32RR-XVIII]NLS02297.1 hypothetical protein [Rhizobium sp. P32RR-XVIII]